MTEIQQQSLYGKCSWRADYGMTAFCQIDEELVVEQSCASGGD